MKKNYHLFYYLKWLSIYLIAFILGIIISTIIKLNTDKNYYGFPAVTKCQICNKTVWEWQSYEKRDFVVKSNNITIPENSNIIGLSISAGGIVHKQCKGNPEFKINVVVK